MGKSYKNILTQGRFVAGEDRGEVIEEYFYCFPAYYVIRYKKNLLARKWELEHLEKKTWVSETDDLKLKTYKSSKLKDLVFKMPSYSQPNNSQVMSYAK